MLRKSNITFTKYNFPVLYPAFVLLTLSCNIQRWKDQIFFIQDKGTLWDFMYTLQFTLNIKWLALVVVFCSILESRVQGMSIEN